MDAKTRNVRAFYEQYSFPGYDDCDSLTTLIDRAQKGVYANLLNREIRFGARILDVGCGTGQLVNFLSSGGRCVIGCDLSYNSLEKGLRFRNQFSLENASFVQADLFDLPFRERSFDVVLCNGVLHHTTDPAAGFGKICAMVKPGGFIVVGLYNSYARTAHNVRKAFLHAFRVSHATLNRILFRRRDYREKELVWFMDQYAHPLESTHTIDEALDWFRRNGIVYLNAIPKISLTEKPHPQQSIFTDHPRGGKVEHILLQLGWVFTQAREGGYFILIGKKPG
jgi:2-polyprenyl-3-methyl-5-hydroxy-6-metoxy-1,4-benzoquinol methylase